MYACMCVYVYNSKKNSAKRHMAIINLFQQATHKSNQPLLIAITQKRENIYKNIFSNDFYSFKKKERKKESGDNKIWATRWCQNRM